MTHILISFLGKAQKQDGQYRQANYGFADGIQKTARFFSFALKQHIFLIPTRRIHRSHALAWECSR